MAYGHLPSYLIALDLRRADTTFLTVDERNSICTAAGIVTPPELHRGTLRGVEAVEHLLGPSRYGSLPAEGVVVRPLDHSEPHAAKLLRPGFKACRTKACRTT